MGLFHAYAFMAAVIGVLAFWLLYDPRRNGSSRFTRFVVRLGSAALIAALWPAVLLGLLLVALDGDGRERWED